MLANLTFNSDASPFELTIRPGTGMFVGGGLMNQSAVSQKFTLLPDNTPGSYFGGSITLQGSVEGVTFTTVGPTEAAGGPGATEIYGIAQVGKATFINNGGVVGGGKGGRLHFHDACSAGTGTVTNKGGTVNGAYGGTTTFFLSSGAHGAVITSEGSAVAGAEGGVTNFFDQSHAGRATLIAESGRNGGGGGRVEFEESSTGGTAAVQVYGNATLDISLHDGIDTVEIGSLEGDGQVYLGEHRLNVGSNNRSTSFAGLIQDTGSGSLSIVGAGTLTLSGANTYTGGTIVSAGALVVSNTSGSATGTGSVAVNDGTLGGGGTISGPVTVGTGSGSGATLQPSFGTTKKIALTIQSQLTLKSDATYTYRLKSRTAEVIANGVTVESGAQFNLVAPNRELPSGKSATVISNTSATPISGAFANLPDGGTITSGSNTFQANYEGGDGNNLTLTVVP